jgi:type VI protein secretion system component Hcp
MKKSMVVGVVLGMGLVSTSAFAVEGTWSMEPTKIKVEAKNEKFTRFWYDVKSPRDATTGQMTGKRQHGLVCIARAASPNTTALFQALVLNESLKTVSFDLANGLRYKLTNANVASFQVVPDKDEEVVCFVFQRIDITNKNGTTVGDSWNAPAI